MATLSDDALVTTDTLESYLGVSGESWDTDETDFAINLINAASARANNITGRELASRTHTDIILDGTGRDIVVLPQYPVTDVSELRIDVSREFGSSTVVDTDDYEYYEDGRLFYHSYFPLDRRCVKVTFTAGYTTVPYDLQQAIAETCAYMWKRLKSRAIGTRSITADGVTTQFEIDIPLPAMRVLQSYRSMWC